MHAACACYAVFGLTNAAPPQLIMATPADDGSITQIFTVPENAKPGESVELLMPDGKRFMFEVRIRTNDSQRARPQQRASHHAHHSLCTNSSWCDILV